MSSTPARQGHGTQLSFYDFGATTFFASQFDQRFSYCLYVPKNYSESEDKLYDLAVIVHGTGRTASQYRDRFADFAELPERMFTRDTKKGPRTADIRLMLRSWSPRHSETGAVEAVTFVADWGNGYLSPLVFCMAVLETLGTPETLRQRIGLLKTAQIFADGQSYPG